MGMTLDAFRDSLRQGLSYFKLSSDGEIARSLRDTLADPGCGDNLAAFASVGLALLGDPSSIARAFEAVAHSPGLAGQKPASAFLGALPLIVPYPREFDWRRDAQMILTWYREHVNHLQWNAASGAFVFAADRQRA
jgi:hypothetical protein